MAANISIQGVLSNMLKSVIYAGKTAMDTASGDHLIGRINQYFALKQSLLATYGLLNMANVNAKYLDKEKEIYPDVETFFNKKSQYFQKCRVYGVCTTYEALQKECADIAELFKNRYPDNNCYYDVSNNKGSGYGTK